MYEVQNDDNGSLKTGARQLSVGVLVRIEGEDRPRRVTYVMGSAAKGWRACFKGQGAVPMGRVRWELVTPPAPVAAAATCPARPSSRAARASARTPAPDRRVFSGYDSAWTRTNRGAIASIVEEGRRRLLVVPELASFDDALSVLVRQAGDVGLHVIGIDQPLIVRNASGRRPVEKGLSPMIGRRGGGMQPANRSRAEMFGDGAPIWSFLDALDAQLDPAFVVNAERGRYAIELYPAAMIAGLFPRLCSPAERGGTLFGPLPKYNPERSSFRVNDWRALCLSVGDMCEALEVDGAPAWCRAAASLSCPRKYDQDKLDAVLCAVGAYLWWAQGHGASVVVGDLGDGYIVLPASLELACELETDCLLAAVPFRSLSAAVDVKLARAARG